MPNKGSVGWLRDLRKRWRLITYWFVFPAVLAYIVAALFVPKKYESSATLLMEGMNNGASIIKTPFGSISKGAMNGSSLSDKTIVTVLKSNFALDMINNKFAIQDRFKLKDRYATREFIKNDLVNIFDDNDNGLIKISVRSKYNNLNPQIANYMVSVIDSANHVYRLTTQNLNSVFVVLDKAEKATISCYPRKKMDALIAGLLGLIICFIYLYFKDRLSMSDEP